MTLDQGIAGHTYIVETLNLAPRIEKRLQALGMISSKYAIRGWLLAGAFRPAL